MCNSGSKVECVPKNKFWFVFLESTFQGDDVLHVIYQFMSNNYTNSRDNNN